MMILFYYKTEEFNYVKDAVLKVLKLNPKKENNE